MKPAPFTYHSPPNLQEALDLVNRLENYKIIAGGQSLMPMMNFRFLMPDHIIDLQHIVELSDISVNGQYLHLGAMTRQHTIHTSDLVTNHAPIVSEAYSMVSHRQVRNRGTYGGSLCHLDPSSEQPCFTAALDGVMEVASISGKKEIPFSNWTAMYMTPQLEANEILLGAKLEIWPKNHGWSFMEYSRRHGDYAVVGVAALVVLDQQSVIKKISLTLCGIDSSPIRLSASEGLMLNQVANEDAIQIAIKEIQEIPYVMEDALNSSDYRRHLAKTLMRRAIQKAFNRSKERQI